jgi:hypothetical protein
VSIVFVASPQPPPSDARLYNYPKLARRDLFWSLNHMIHIYKM